MPVVVTLDGTDISSQSIYVTGEPDGWLDAPQVSYTVSPLSGRVGGIVASHPDIAARKLTIPLRIIGTTTTTRQTAETWLKGKLTSEILVKIDDDSSDRQLRGVVQAVALRPYKRLLSTVSYGSVTMLCGDPCWQDISATDLALTDDVETAISMGNAPVRHWSLAVTGSVTDVTVAVRNGDGDTLATLFWDGTMTTETLTIDSANGLVMLDATNEFANYTGGFPELNPLDEPTIEVTSASGTVAGTLSYRKRYW